MSGGERREDGWDELRPSDNNRVEAALQQAAARVSAVLFALVPDEVFDAVQRAVLDDPAVVVPLRRKRERAVQQGNCSNCGEPYATHYECGEFG